MNKIEQLYYQAQADLAEAKSIISNHLKDLEQEERRSKRVMTRMVILVFCLVALLLGVIYGAQAQTWQEGGNPYSPDSMQNPYSQGRNPYNPDGLTSPYGRYQNRYSTESRRNPYGDGLRVRPDPRQELELAP